MPAAVRDLLEHESIHYQLVPAVNAALIDAATERLVECMQRIILLGRVVRDRKTLPLRHPLKELVVIVEAYADIERDIEHVRAYIYEELNVKQLRLTAQRAEYGIEMKAKANFPVLAAKCKERMKTLSGAIEKLADAHVQQLRDQGKFVLDGYELVLEDIKILPKCNASEFSQYEADFDENVSCFLFHLLLKLLKRKLFF